ncbi:hypothetical protein IWQ61_009383 [Dispira simplex]|nr:hypothetical protein IWQ61_009383 [Dispira simplex]
MKTTRHLEPSGYSTTYATKISGSNQIALSNNDQAKFNADKILRLKKAWDQSFSPAKSLPMTLFMMWMSGNSVQIFNLVITVMMFFQPVKALSSVHEAFKRFEAPDSTTAVTGTDINLLFPKVVFVLLNLLQIVLGLWKCSNMGLLPTTASDWLAFEVPPTPLEYSMM